MKNRIFFFTCIISLATTSMFGAAPAAASSATAHDSSMQGSDQPSKKIQAFNPRNLQTTYHIQLRPTSAEIKVNHASRGYFLAPFDCMDTLLAESPDAKAALACVMQAAQVCNILRKANTISHWMVVDKKVTLNKLEDNICVPEYEIVED